MKNINIGHLAFNMTPSNIHLPTPGLKLIMTINHEGKTDLKDCRSVITTFPSFGVAGATAIFKTNVLNEVGGYRVREEQL